MSPRFSRAERDKPPPRRKSCLACAKSKRRCDQRLPSCLRCSQRQIDCEYPTRILQSSRTHPCSEAQYEERVVSRDENGESGSIADETTSVENTWMTSGELTTYPLFPWPDSSYHELTQLHEEPGPAFETLSEWPEVTPLLDIPAFEETSHSQKLPSAPLSTDVASTEAVPSLPVVPAGYMNVEAISAQLEFRLSYAVDKIKSAPTTMLLELQAPWCHATLYKDKMPRVMQDCLSACALYASKTVVNRSVIMRCIDAKVNDLLASHLPTDFLDALARVQALLLYQIIRFFDGDILARSSADATFHELRSSAEVLATYIIWDSTTSLDDPDVSGETALFPLQASYAIWKRWVQQESARRTFLIACFFVSVWKILTGRQARNCPEDPAHLGQSWTLSAKIWQARDAVDFALAWRERNHYIVRRGAISSTLLDAHGDDVEAFGKMLLTVSMGIEEARAWLAVKGTSL